MPSAKAKTAGFTLIEIMVVIIVFGIAISVVSLTIGNEGPDSKLRDIAERFAILGNFASERAVLSRQPVGLLLEPPAWQEELDSEPSWRYRWQRMGPTGWQDEPGLDAVSLPPTVQLDVMIEGQMWEWDEQPEVRLPAVVFYPSGEVTQFEIEFRDERMQGFAQHVVVNDWGEVAWLEQPSRDPEVDNAF